MPWKFIPSAAPCRTEWLTFQLKQLLCYGDPKAAFNQNLKSHYAPLPTLASAKKKKDKQSLFRRWKLALSCLLLTGKE